MAFDVDFSPNKPHLKASGVASSSMAFHLPVPMLLRIFQRRFKSLKHQYYFYLISILFDLYSGIIPEIALVCLRLALFAPAAVSLVAFPLVDFFASVMYLIIF